MTVLGCCRALRAQIKIQKLEAVKLIPLPVLAIDLRRSEEQAGIRKNHEFTGGFLPSFSEGSSAGRAFTPACLIFHDTVINGSQIYLEVSTSPVWQKNPVAGRWKMFT